MSLSRVRRFSAIFACSCALVWYCSRGDSAGFSTLALSAMAALLLFGPWGASTIASRYSSRDVAWWSALIAFTLGGALLHDSLFLANLAFYADKSLIYAEADVATQCLFESIGSYGDSQCDVRAAEERIDHAKQVLLEDAVWTDTEVIHSAGLINRVYRECHDGSALPLASCKAIEWSTRFDSDIKCKKDCVSALPFPGDCYTSCMTSDLRLDPALLVGHEAERE